MLYETTSEISGILSRRKNTCLIKTGQPNTDSRLWTAFKQGDEFAFSCIYKNYSAELFNYGCRYADDQEMVRDCLHDFFIYLKKNRGGFSDTNSIKWYLFKAFRRRIAESLKKNNYDFGLNDPSECSPLNVVPSIETLYINEEIHGGQMEQLNMALKQLNTTELKVVYYFYFKGLSYDQIAKMLKFTHVSSARRVLYRSLKLLRHYYN